MPEIPHLQLMLPFDSWMKSHSGDPTAFALVSRHYSHRPYADGRRDDRKNPARFQFVGPGERLVLLTPDARAVFAWRLSRYFTGVCCTLFRNESPILSSNLILEAERHAREKWPHEWRFFTHVNAAKVRSPNPGYCFLCAGWRRVGRTRSGLLILEKRVCT